MTLKKLKKTRDKYRIAKIKDNLRQDASNQQHVVHREYGNSQGVQRVQTKQDGIFVYNSFQRSNICGESYVLQKIQQKVFV